MKKFITLVTILISFAIYAQQVTHTMAAKETLYGLSKKYNVSIDEIKKANPKLHDRNPQIGEVLVIPSKGNKTSSVNNAKSSSTKAVKYVYYEVKPKETLYGLGKKFGISIDEIRTLNPEMNEAGPKIGEVLKFPDTGKVSSEEIAQTSTKTKNEKVEKAETVKSAPSTNVTATEYTDGYNVIMFLPFNTDDKSKAGERNISKQFYSGAEIALDSLIHNGYKINLKLMDSGNDDEYQQIVNSYDFSNTDLIIGPLFKSSILTLAEKLKNTKTVIVSPFSSSNDLDPYANIIMYETKEEYMIDKICEEFLKKYAGEKIYLLYDNQNKMLADYAEKVISSKYKDADISQITKAEEIIPSQNLVTGEDNKLYAFVLSDNDTFIEKYLQKIITMNPKLVSPLSLHYFPKFDKSPYDSKLLDLGLIYSDNKYVNESGFNESKTINKYKKSYCTTPDKYAVMGFDVTFDILSRLGKGKTISPSIMSEEKKQLSNKYYFERVDNKGAWTNRGTRVIQLINH